jgi:hypothetical protein
MVWSVGFELLERRDHLRAVGPKLNRLGEISDGMVAIAIGAQKADTRQTAGAAGWCAITCREPPSPSIAAELLQCSETTRRLQAAIAGRRSLRHS